MGKSDLSEREVEGKLRMGAYCFCLTISCSRFVLRKHIAKITQYVCGNTFWQTQTPVRAVVHTL